jgi:hypothetical protein
VLIDPLFASANGLKAGTWTGDWWKNLSNRRDDGFAQLHLHHSIERGNDQRSQDVWDRGSEPARPGKPARQNQIFIRSALTRVRISTNRSWPSRTHLVTDGVDITRWESTENNSKVTVVAMEVTTLGTMSKVVPGMLLALSIILISMLLKRMIQRESAVIGTLYALGYRKREILRHYLLYPLLVAGGGGCWARCWHGDGQTHARLHDDGHSPCRLKLSLQL